MKIVQLLHGKNYGGMESFCINLSNTLSQEHDVLFIGEAFFMDYLSETVRFVAVDTSKSRNNPLFLWKLYRILRDFSPDIIHVHKQKSIETMKRLDFLLKVPFVATKHDTQIKKAFHGLDYAISISDETKLSIKVKHIFKIYNGIPYIEPTKISMPKDFNIVTIGGLRKVKGYDMLIEAVSRLSFPFHLTIIGEGDERPYLEERILTLGLDEKVSLVGFKSNVNDYLYSSDLQIISSKSEGFSLSMIEGNFYSKVLISTKVSGCTEILNHTLLYDMPELTKKIDDIYDNYDDYVKVFHNIKSKYKESLTIGICVKEHEKVYTQIIKDYHD